VAAAVIRAVPLSPFSFGAGGMAGVAQLSWSLAHVGHRAVRSADQLSKGGRTPIKALQDLQRRSTWAISKGASHFNRTA
jgi:hypothetical protein